jgi:hypothetical protein
MEEQDDRLLRIEQKVDKLSDVIVSIARAEEKLLQLGTITDTLFKKVDHVNERITQMEKSSAETKALVNGFSKVAWVFTSGLLTALAGIFAYNILG